MAAAIASHTFRALGTFATLLVTEPEALQPGRELLAAELAAMDLACSRFRSDSELWRVNQAGGRPMRVSELFTEALIVGLAAARLTDGDVDPTCGQSLIKLGYDKDFTQARRETGRLPLRAVPAGGWRRIELDPDRQEVRVPAGIALDLGATAKALAADRAAITVAAELGCGALVNLGGDLRVAGEPPPDGWRVGIADNVSFDASADGIEPDQVVMIHDGGLATSSPLGRCWRRDGVRLHHIIEPATGLPVQSCWRTASVAAATCVDANIASTAAIVRGERVVGWLDGLRLPARLVRSDGSIVLAGGWPPGTACGCSAGAACCAGVHRPTA